MWTTSPNGSSTRPPCGTGIWASTSVRPSARPIPTSPSSPSAAASRTTASASSAWWPAASTRSSCAACWRMRTCPPASPCTCCWKTAVPWPACPWVPTAWSATGWPTRGWPGPSWQRPTAPSTTAGSSATWWGPAPSPAPSATRCWWWPQPTRPGCWSRGGTACPATGSSPWAATSAWRPWPILPTTSCCAAAAPWRPCGKPTRVWRPGWPSAPPNCASARPRPAPS